MGGAGYHTLHATLVRVAGSGVLLTGEPGVGKSQLALELVGRGHALVADDQVLMRTVARDHLEGRADANGEGFLVVRGLGALNLEKLFGPRAVVQGSAIHLQLRLVTDPRSAMGDPLSGAFREVQLLGIPLRELTLAASRDGLAGLVEVAARDALLRRRGYHADQVLATRLGTGLKGDSSCE